MTQQWSGDRTSKNVQFILSYLTTTFIQTAQHIAICIFVAYNMHFNYPIFLGIRNSGEKDALYLNSSVRGDRIAKIVKLGEHSIIHIYVRARARAQIKVKKLFYRNKIYYSTLDIWHHYFNAWHLPGTLWINIATCTCN